MAYLTCGLLFKWAYDIGGETKRSEANGLHERDLLRWWAFSTLDSEGKQIKYCS